jgi:hypothetical protein
MIALATNPILMVFAITFIAVFFIEIVGISFTAWGKANPKAKTNIALLSALAIALLSVLVHLLVAAVWGFK